MIDAAADYEIFNYHPKCKRVKLIHLCFTNDLLIFAKGNMESVIGIQNVLEQYYRFFGLQINCSKSEIFSTGMTRDTLEMIHQETRFKLGSLPVRYLRVPLVTRRLSIRDCEPPVKKVIAKIKCWSTNLLSHTGRLQLIKSILFSLQNFWCRIFLLPKGVMKRICQLCAGFLWRGNEHNARGAKVSWEEICLPKSEGGLGLKDIISWNTACMLQNI